LGINESLVITWAMMSVRMTTPILFAALGGLLTSRTGVFNLALEGMMLSGAFFGYYGALTSGSPWMGLLVALLIGILLGLLFAYFSVTLNVNQVITSIGINTVALGLTSYFSRVLLTDSDVIVAPTFKDIVIPGLSDLPIIGPIVFSHSILVYLSILILIIVNWFLFKTTNGLNLRAIGEDATACKTVGINVALYRYLAIIACGALASIGGAYITTVAVNRFLENIVEGRGWIAFAAIIFGRNMPLGVFGACLLFGAATALQMLLQVQGFKIPYRFALMIPYVVTMLTIALIAKKEQIGKVDA
jgi:ABC-type uncharacterized transport system permease subunit